MLHCGGDAHFDTEFVRPVRFALADALDLWGVQGIDLAAALATLLLQHAPSQEQGPYERFPQIFIPDDAPFTMAQCGPFDHGQKNQTEGNRAVRLIHLQLSRGC